MKRKGLIVVACIMAFSIFFANTSYAQSVSKKISAVFGKYIIKINGKVQKTTTLANGSTVYIPINNVKQLTGATVKKSGNTYAITPVNFDEIKMDVKYLDMYKNLSDFDGGFYSLLSLGDAIENNIKTNQSNDQLDSLNNYYNEYIDLYNKDLDNFHALEKDAKAKNYSYKKDSTTINAIFNDYSQSLSYMGKMIDDLSNLYQTKDSKYEDQYNADYDAASNFTDKGYNLADSNYSAYLKVIEKK